MALAILVIAAAGGTAGLSAEESFVGSFAEPQDGGNLDTRWSSFDGSTVVIVPRAHASEALGGARRWRNVLFAIRGVKGKTPRFELPLASPGSGSGILSGNAVSINQVRLVWSYEAQPANWQNFDSLRRSGTNPASWTIEAANTAPFVEDVVYVSINERASVSEFYEWLEASVFTHPLVRPTPSAISPDTFVIGFQSGAPASDACSRDVPDVPLFGFVIRDPASHPTKLVMLVSGQHPYEGQNKVALRAAIEWILHSSSAEAKAYRAEYLTLVYPFVNPTGELAGLWRGTAAAPYRDTNRNWGTTETLPARDRGIDTVIVHKNAMIKDIAALGLGEPFAMFDYHQNYGDREGEPDYVLHSTTAIGADPAQSPDGLARIYSPYFERLSGHVSMASRSSDLSSPETLRGYMLARGVPLPITFERSVYNTLASEREFGLSTVRALVPVAAGLARSDRLAAVGSDSTGVGGGLEAAEGSVAR